jgi:hypothetical protein
MSMIIAAVILVLAGTALFVLGFLVGRRSRPAVRGFDVVAVHDEKQH